LNLHLWRDGDNTYHLKGMWIDQRYTLLTGNNLNPRAFRLDLENALLIDDPKGELLEPRRKSWRRFSRTPVASSDTRNWKRCWSTRQGWPSFSSA
jgi:Phosphatidylserine/phosphatidylglycerophosphate/cardiolipin synthases and related enzymes